MENEQKEQRQEQVFGFAFSESEMNIIISGLMELPGKMTYPLLKRIEAETIHQRRLKQQKEEREVNEMVGAIKEDQAQ